MISGVPASAPRRFIVQAPSEAALQSIDAVESAGARIDAQLPLIKGVAVEVDAAKEADLRALAQKMSLKLFEDRPVALPEPDPVGPEVDVPGYTWTLDAGTRAIGARELWAEGFTGKGVTVAVIDTGLAPHRDFGSRVIGFHDVIEGKTDPYDDHGHGTHVSGTVGGDGAASRGWIKGVAPEASLVGVKVLDGGGSGTFSGVIEGIQWAVQNKERYNIKVINLSLGASVEEAAKDDPVVQAIEAAEAAGILPVIAAGNSGPFPSTIGTPGNAPAALTVAALDDRGTPWTWDDRMALFSSRGPTPIDGFQKPDVAAPGVAIMATKANSKGYTQMSGTSMASPMVAGAAALLFQAHPDATPAEVKAALMDTAHSLWGFSEKAQGKGRIDLPAAHDRLR